jgi:hypothetical protein
MASRTVSRFVAAAQAARLCTESAPPFHPARIAGARRSGKAGRATESEPVMSSRPESSFYRAAAATAIGTGLLQVWMNLAVGIVGREDNPVNLGFHLVVVTAAACAFTARAAPAGMARAMLATAAVQMLLAAVIATAPSTVRDDPKGPLGVLILGGGFAALWLLSAALFHRSARRPRSTAPA